jgi:hypothetical protein
VVANNARGVLRYFKDNPDTKKGKVAPAGTINTETCLELRMDSEPTRQMWLVARFQLRWFGWFGRPLYFRLV